MTCRICETRRPRRYCPGVRGDICSLCCGTEREVTVDCPLECEYLQEARIHERPPILNPDSFPNQDIRITDEFLRRNEPLLLMIASGITETALSVPGVVDADVREALEALIKTYRTLDSGLIYESRPTNPLAGRIYERVQQEVAEIRERLRQSAPIQTVRDAEVLGVVVFLQRLSIQHDNGRRKGRAFLDFLRQYFEPAGTPQGSVLQP